jgi:hypothetical protein
LPNDGKVHIGYDFGQLRLQNFLGKRSYLIAAGV